VRADEGGFLADAPWDECDHGNYVEGCRGCWVALVGQAKKASEWQGALERAVPLLRETAGEVRTMTRKGRDERQRRILCDVEALLARITGP
jgi:hypothetical protein